MSHCNLEFYQTKSRLAKTIIRDGFRKILETKVLLVSMINSFPKNKLANSMINIPALLIRVSLIAQIEIIILHIKVIIIQI